MFGPPKPHSESEATKNRFILHLDMDAFFAAVEVLCHPHLAGKPLIICGDPRKRSVVSTASYEAREYGIKSGMSVTEAREKCPHGIFWKGRPEKYVHYSLRILELIKQHTSQVEPFSIDEAFIDLTGRVFDLGSAVEGARRIKKEIRERFGLTATIGISSNKILAKMASDLDKPDGLRVLLPQDVSRILHPLPVDTLWGVGRKTAARLGGLGIKTVGDLAAYPPLKLRRVFGVVGEWMVKMAQGVDHTPVIPYYDGIPPKSVGHEHTLGRDIPLGPELRCHLLRLTDQVARRLRRAGLRGRRVTVKIRFSHMKTITRQCTLRILTDEENVIYQAAREILNQNVGGEKVRLVGVSVSSLEERSSLEQEMIFEMDYKRRYAIGMVDSIRDRFGEHAVTRAAVLSLRRRRHPTFVLPSFLAPYESRE